MRRILCLLALVAAVVPAVAVEEGPVFMWRAEKDGAVIHLLGSIHAGRDDWYPLDPRIDDAFTEADTIACEMDVSDPALQVKVSLLAMKEGMYPPDESLKDHISDATWEALTAVEGLAVPAAMLDRMRPGMAATMVMQAVLARTGLDVTQGVDMHLLERARAAARPVVSLETPEQQVALLFGPDALIDGLMLEEALRESPDTMVAMLNGLIATWRDGDPVAMEKIYREDWGDEERMVRFHEELVVTRNRGMAAGLQQRRGRWFVVVGALHLCGEHGVPTLLADAGWRVTQVGRAVAVR